MKKVLIGLMVVTLLLGTFAISAEAGSRNRRGGMSRGERNTRMLVRTGLELFRLGLEYKLLKSGQVVIVHHPAPVYSPPPVYGPRAGDRTECDYLRTASERSACNKNLSRERNKNAKDLGKNIGKSERYNNYGYNNGGRVRFVRRRY